MSLMTELRTVRKACVLYIFDSYGATVDVCRYY